MENEYIDNGYNKLRTRSKKNNYSKITEVNMNNRRKMRDIGAY